MSESEGTTAQVLRDRTDETRSADDGGGAALAGGPTSSGGATRSATTATPRATAATGLASSLRTPPGGPPPSSAATAKESESRGAALPGDRGPRTQKAQSQRPSFWRRIALGRRHYDAPTPPTPPMPPTAPAPETDVAPPNAQTRPPVPIATDRPSLAERAKNVVAPAPPAPAVDTKAIEKVIVEPMLQALVSVEAKLERSHTDLVTRNDAVEQRLTQLWDIEEQLGTLSELQDSLLQVSEQQRRLENAVVAQTKTLRWLVGAVFFSLASAAFVVAAVLP